MPQSLQREDRWEAPHELYRDSEIEVTPYYLTAQLPNAEKPEFLLMLPLSVAGKNQMAGWLAGLSDGDNYGLDVQVMADNVSSSLVFSPS
jgi:uncharacterized protein